MYGRWGVWFVDLAGLFYSGPESDSCFEGYLVLGEYLGIATVVVGLLTGSFFGVTLDAVEWPWLKGVKQYFVTEANYGKYLNGYNPMMVVAVVIGITQFFWNVSECCKIDQAVWF